MPLMTPNKVHATLESEAAKTQVMEELAPEEAKQNSIEEDKKSEEIPEEPKVPEIKNRRGDDFIESFETLEYLKKVRFLESKNKQKAGANFGQEIDDADLTPEEKMLKSILKRSIKPESDDEQLSSRRKVKASELAREKRKKQESNLISGNFAMSGIQIPETQNAKQRRIQKEKQEERDAPWKALMETDEKDEDKLRDTGGYLEFKELQEYSRENIVIYKRISNLMIRWIVSVGKVFDKHGYYFIPVKIIGSPMHQRSTIIYFMIYLEIMKFPRSAIVDKEFESIWPFLLYLLNNWIRHQLSVMGFTNSKELDQKILERRRETHEKQIDNNYNREEGIKQRDFNKRQKLMEMTVEQKQKLELMGFEEKEAERYKEILNFSSEIEYDDAYDIFDDENENKIEASKIKKQDSKIKKKEVYPDIIGNKDSIENNAPFQLFLAEHTVKLPDTNTNRFKLLKNMQAKSYFELNAKGLELDTILLMNQERRRHKKLPPLTPLDYNCIDKAATKLKTILDTMSVIRKINGKFLQSNSNIGRAIVRRNIKEYSLELERITKMQKNFEWI